MAFAKKNQLIGLDIGSHSIKLVEIDQASRGMVLNNFGVIGLPPDAIVEGSIKEPEIVSSAIKTLIKNLNVKGKDVATSISGYSVITKKITLSGKEEGELERTIEEEAEQYIPFDISEVNLDFDILTLGNRPSGIQEEDNEEGSQLEVMLVAAKKDIVNEYINLLHLSGLNAAVLDVDAFALQNAFEISTENLKGCYALVHIGAESIIINAVKDGESLFTRDSSYGGSQINDLIVSEFKVSYEEAEKIKLGGSDDVSQGLDEIFKSVVSDWVSEIIRALDFVVSTFPDERIEKIFLGGGSSKIPGCQKYLELETNTPVTLFNPFSRLIVREKQFDPNYLKYMAPQAGVAVGLALRKIGDK